jgi:hypothetical protein
MFHFAGKAIKPGGSNSLGDATSTTEIPFKCYKKEELKVVINSLGKEETSSVQLYLLGEQAQQITAADTITYDNVSKRRIIRREVFFGPLGKAVLGVLYLP